ncbi:MAG TPA: guanylate kinase [Candidatus Fimisoma avicola]|uniref:Guanylate kinase n=1 Tax=Candidatus Fimisoma avicola TaxID=2840826 RepID=A0A9D1I3H1_9FIRM|nr:guanylate kinase [Candidatus Fimisoma avicola]
MMSSIVKNTGKLFVLSGPSGAGKGTICKRLLEETNKLDLSVSMTTRKPRIGETEGVSYFFTEKEVFQEHIKKGNLLEYAEVYGNYYGTPKTPVLDKLSRGIDVILEIDMQGALKVKESYPDGVFIFILPPSMTELRKRLTGRGTETAEAIELRLGEALKELSYIDKYDYCVVNGVLEEAVARVKAIVVAEHSKVAFTAEELIESYKEEA